MKIPELGTELMNQLTDCCGLDATNIQFVQLDTENKKIVVSFDYADPEETGDDTIFCCY